MDKNNNEHLKTMLEKLKRLQEQNNSIKKVNDSSSNSFPSSSTNSERNKLLTKKLDEIRKKRMDLERTINNNSNNDFNYGNNSYPSNFNSKSQVELSGNNYSNYNNQVNNRTVDMEFIAERGYSKTSYLKVLSAIDGIKENLVKLSSIPNLNKILSSNLIISNGLDEVISAMVKVLPTFFEDIIEKKIDEIEMNTRQIETSFAKEENNNVLDKIERQINSLVEAQTKNQNSVQQNSNLNNRNNRDDDLDALELEMNLINNLLFKK